MTCSLRLSAAVTASKHTYGTK